MEPCEFEILLDQDGCLLCTAIFFSDGDESRNMFQFFFFLGSKYDFV